jgi:hypothetical protein
MASLGIWLWSNRSSFGIARTCPVSTTILGQPVHLGSSQLRTWSIVIYSVFLAPGINLILPLGLFLGLFLSYQAWHRRRNPHPELNTPSIVPTVIGMVLLLTINVIFLVNIELTLRQNRELQSPGESLWTFGQILAILLLVLPLRDLVETVLSRHEKRRRKEHTELLRNAIKESATSETIRAIVKHGADVNVMVEGTRPILAITSILNLAF